eukprot:5836345-Prymnesium_polylepis.2
MEKAFESGIIRVYEKGLDAYGFGARLRKWVGRMYDEKKAPQKRMYVNGYFSEWLPILSGVAQGCLLSSLLFLSLYMAEAMQVAIPRKGAKRRHHYISGIKKRAQTGKCRNEKMVPSDGNEGE